METIDPIKFGRRVAELRILRGYETQRALAKAIGVSASGIGNVEQGKVTEPTFMYRLVNGLATTHEWLWWQQGPRDVGDVPATQPSPQELVDMIEKMPAEQRNIFTRMLRSSA